MFRLNEIASYLVGLYGAEMSQVALRSRVTCDARVELKDWAISDLQNNLVADKHDDDTAQKVKSFLRTKQKQQTRMRLLDDCICVERRAAALPVISMVSEFFQPSAENGQADITTLLPPNPNQNTGRRNNGSWIKKHCNSGTGPTCVN